MHIRGQTVIGNLKASSKNTTSTFDSNFSEWINNDPQ